LSDIFFEYELPTELIAQHPAQQREDSRLMVVDRKNQSIQHRFFRDLPDYLQTQDLLVLNNTRVVKARLLGTRKATGGKWEGLYLHTLPDGRWEIMSHTRGWIQPGEVVSVGDGSLELIMDEKTPAKNWFVRPNRSGTAIDLLQMHGHVPLPPYIRKGRAEEADLERYQTVFAQSPGAVAAPTAGLHFTPELFQRLESQGIRKAFVTLHVGPGTFKPLPESLPEVYNVDPEFGILPQETLTAIQECKQNQGRLVSVGTTSTRLLETAARANPNQPWQGWADLTIRPPFKFEQVDILITNFHLPRSTLLLLVGAFAGDNLIRLAYDEAIKNQYRFFSYGDAMLIL